MLQEMLEKLIKIILFFLAFCLTVFVGFAISSIVAYLLVKEI